MRTGSPISPIARPTATLVALALALSTGPAAAQAPPAETLPTPVRVEGTHGPVPLAVPPSAPPPVLYANQATPSPETSGVTLRSGQVLSGTVVQVISGQQVVLDTPDGQHHIIPWDQVADLRYAAVPTEAPTVAPVRPGRIGVLTGGILFTSLSIAPLISGTLYLSLNAHSNRSGHSTRDAGIVLSAVGVSMLVTGIIMIAFGRTRVELYRRYTGAAQRRPKPAAAL